MQTAKTVSVLLRGLEVWLLISIAETLHGIARVAFLQPIVGDFRARQIAVVTGSFMILAIAIFFRNWLLLTTKRAAAAVGVLWIGLTIAFEIVLGRLVMDLPWERMWEDYNIKAGGLMVFGLSVMFASPFAALWYKRRGKINEIANVHSAA